jgi:hypothetical protein
MTWIIISCLVMALGLVAGLYFWKRGAVNKVFVDEAKRRELELLKAAEQKLKDRLENK